jgi:hypothetical protein
MKQFTKILIGIACAAAVTVPALAQEKRSSIQVFGNYSKTENSDASGTVSLGYGYLVSSQIEVGASISTKIAKDNSSSIVGSGQYYFSPVGRPGQFNPYIKAQLGTTTGLPENYTTYGGALGAAYPMSEAAEFFVEAGATKGTGSVSTTTTAVDFGIKVRF